MMFARLLVVCAGLAMLWQALVWATGVPVYILPGPWLVATTFVAEFGTYTLVNLVFGLFILVAMQLYREVLWKNRVNRRFLWTLWTAFIVALVWWPGAWLMEMPFGHVVESFDEGLFGSGFH